METPCTWHFCLFHTYAIVDNFRSCDCGNFPKLDLLLFQRDMADTWIIFMVHTSQYFYDKSNPQKGLLWSGLFPLRDIDNYFFLRFYILLGFDKKCSLTSSNQTKTEKSGVICLKCTIFGNVSKKRLFVSTQNPFSVSFIRRLEIFSQFNEAMSIFY